MKEIVTYINQDSNRAKRFYRISPKAITATIILSTLLIIAAEAITTFAGVIPGTISYSILLIGLSNLYYFSRESRIQQIALALTLVPILRILSLAMPVPQTVLTIWLVMTGVPLLLAAGLVLRMNGLPSLKLKLDKRQWIHQLLFAISGIPLGVAAFVLLPSLKIVPVIPRMNWEWLVVGAVSLILFNALTEELIFRGVIQNAYVRSLGPYGFLVSSLIYACMFLGTLSVDYILFYGIIGLLFAYWVQKTGSLWGTVAAHSLMNILFILILPLILK